MKKIYWQDIMLISGFILYLLAGFTTKMIISEVGVYTDAAVQLESNLIARQFIDIRYGTIMMLMTYISIYGGRYYMIRRKNLKDPTEYNYTMWSFFTIAMFLLFMQNAANDLPILLGILYN